MGTIGPIGVMGRESPAGPLRRIDGAAVARPVGSRSAQALVRGGVAASASPRHESDAPDA